MSYYSEAEEVRTTVPTYVEFRTYEGSEAGLPEGYMIEQDGKHFRPRHYVDYVVPATDRISATHVKGWSYFYHRDRSTQEFSSFEDTREFLLGWIGFLQWMDGLFSEEEQMYREGFEAGEQARRLDSVLEITPGARFIWNRYLDYFIEAGEPGGEPGGNDWWGFYDGYIHQ